MNIEKEIFKNSTVNYNKLIEYGFININNNYIYECNFMNDEFRAIITINDREIIG